MFGQAAATVTPALGNRVTAACLRVCYTATARAAPRGDSMGPENTLGQAAIRLSPCSPPVGHVSSACSCTL